MEIMQSNSIKLVATVIIIYLLWRIKFFIDKYRFWSKAASQVSVIGPLHPIWGSLHLFSNFTDIMNQFRKKANEENAKLVCYWNMFLFPSFSVVHPDTAKIILKSSEPKTVNPGGGYAIMKPWIGEGLLISSGKKWERSRRLLTPGFHFDILKPYVEIYNRSSDSFLNNLKPFTDRKEAVDIFPLVTLATLDTILKCAFSYNGDIQTKGEKHPYAAAVIRLSQVLVERFMRPWLHVDFIFSLTGWGREHNRLCDYVHEFSENIIEKRKSALAKDGAPSKRHLDFLDILLTAKDENGIGLSDKDIRAEVDTFLFEGHDTTASAVSWAIYHLAKYPEEQDKVYQEVMDVVGDHTDMTWEHLQSIPLLTAFLKESMRMVAPVPGISRLLTKPLEVDGVVLPPNVMVDIPIYTIHHHPDVWPDHEVFKPDRFLDTKIIDRHPFSFIPFSAGSRNCIGQHFAIDEMKIMIGRLVKSYKVDLVSGCIYEPSIEIVTRAKDGIKLYITSR